jgi:hypothetical protein
MTAATVPARHASLPSRMSAELAWRLGQYTQRLGWDADQLAAHQRDRLRVLLAHAAEHSPFHARRLRGLDLERLELTDLARLPVMTKSQMMAEFDDVVTDRRFSRRLAERHLAASARQPGLLLDEYVCLASGGSSGLRGIFVQTLGEFADFVASVVRPGYARALAAGGPPPGGLVLGIVAAASPVHSSGFGAAAAGTPAGSCSLATPPMPARRTWAKAAPWLSKTPSCSPNCFRPRTRSRTRSPASRPGASREPATCSSKAPSPPEPGRRPPPSATPRYASAATRYSGIGTGRSSPPPNPAVNLAAGRRALQEAAQRPDEPDEVLALSGVEAVNSW